MGQIDLGQRNAFFPNGLRLIVEGVHPEEKIVSFREKNSGVGLDLYPNHPCMQDSLYLIEDARNRKVIPNCPNCNGQREFGSLEGRYDCYFCGLKNSP